MSTAPLPSELPEELLPLSWLLGTWVGVGTGQYPGIEDFRFGQEISFATDGRPFMAYISRSWLLDDEGERVKPLATETGFWRPRPENKVELTLAHPARECPHHRREGRSQDYECRSHRECEAVLGGRTSLRPRRRETSLDLRHDGHGQADGQSPGGQPAEGHGAINGSGR